MVAKNRLSGEEFIKMWQTSQYIEDAEEKSGMNRISLQTRAYKYAKVHGIELRRLRSKKKRGIDKEGLQKLAKELQPQK